MGEKIEAAVQDALDWLDKNQLAAKDEFEAKQKEIEGIVNPIMMKVYQAAGGWHARRRYARWWYARWWWRRWPNCRRGRLRKPTLSTRAYERCHNVTIVEHVPWTFFS